MFYQQDIIDEVLARSDIVDVIGGYVSLKQKGSSYTGLCPFHREKTPSFSVSADKQLFKCFGCGEAGNVFGFIMKTENLAFPEAVRFLADRAHYTLPEGKFEPDAAKTKAVKEKLFAVNKLAARFFFDCLNSADGETAAAYLDKRRVSQSARRRFGLGASPDKWDSLYKFLKNEGYGDDILKQSGLVLYEKGPHDKFRNRLMFPIFSALGEVTGFGGRILNDGNPKYLNSPETPVFEKSKNLYGINYARKSKAKELILVEGYMDVIALNQAGFTNAVASLGTAFNKEHARLLKRYAPKAVLVFDSDTAGVTATLRAIPELENNGITCRVLTLSGAKDPDEFIAAYGSEAFQNAVDQAAGSVSFRISAVRNKYNLSKTEERVDFTAEAAKLLAALPSAVEKSVYAKEVSKMTGLPEEAINAEVRAAEGNEKGVRLPVRLKTQAEKDQAEAGAKEARRSLLRLAASSKGAAFAISEVIQPFHLVENTLAELLTVITEKHKSGSAFTPAEVINYFDTYEKQREAADIFSGDMPEITEEADAQRNITQLVRKVLEVYYDRKANEAGMENDAEQLNKILENKRNLGKLNIKVTDC
jgi:DNA primase